MVHGKEKPETEEASSTNLVETQPVPKAQDVREAGSFKRTKIAVAFLALGLLSALALSRACHSKPLVNTDNDAILVSAPQASEDRNAAMATASKASENSNTVVASASKASENSNTLASRSPYSIPNRNLSGPALAREQTVESYERRAGVQAWIDNQRVHPLRGDLRPSKDFLLDYPSVSDKTFVELTRDSTFAITLHASKKMIVDKVSLDAGDYVLKLKSTAENWDLLFFRVGGDSPVGTLRIDRFEVKEGSNALSVRLYEFGNKAMITIYLGKEVLTGFFETQ